MSAYIDDTKTNYVCPLVIRTVFKTQCDQLDEAGTHTLTYDTAV